MSDAMEKLLPKSKCDFKACNHKVLGRPKWWIEGKGFTLYLFEEGYQIKTFSTETMLTICDNCALRELDKFKFLLGNQ